MPERLSDVSSTIIGVELAVTLPSFRIIFSVPGLIVSDVERDVIKIDFDQAETKVLLNDGFGTEDELTVVGSEYKVGKTATQKTKDWKKADEIRKKINNLGYILEDTKEGTNARKKD